MLALLNPDYSPVSHVVLLCIAGLLLLSLSCYLVYFSARKILRKKFIFGMGVGALSVILLLTVCLSALLLGNLYIYQRLTTEKRVATIAFELVNKQHFRAVLEEENGRTREYDLLGDEWQLDARILKWQGSAVLLGLDTFYRLVRVQGRYRNIQEERENHRSVYSLADESALDLWSLTHSEQLDFPWVDGVYGSSTFLPMVDDGKFGVYVTTSGLIARPLNQPASGAIQSW